MFLTILTKTKLISTNVGIASDYLPQTAIYNKPSESVNCVCDLEHSSKCLELLNQTIKLFDEPCQKPHKDITKIIKINLCRNVFLFPPSGM